MLLMEYEYMQERRNLEEIRYPCCSGRVHLHPGSRHARFLFVSCQVVLDSRAAQRHDARSVHRLHICLRAGQDRSQKEKQKQAHCVCSNTQLDHVAHDFSSFSLTPSCQSSPAKSSNTGSLADSLGRQTTQSVNSRGGSTRVRRGRRIHFSAITLPRHVVIAPVVVRSGLVNNECRGARLWQPEFAYCADKGRRRRCYP